MKSQLKRRMRRRNSAEAMIPCCYGVVYTLTDDTLGIIADSADEILNRLRTIDGVEVLEVRGRWCDLKCPPLRLPDVTSVLVPLDSARAPAALAAAAHRGHIRRNPLDHDRFVEPGRPSVGRPSPKSLRRIARQRD
jgi:hypothetical protein